MSPRRDLRSRGEPAGGADGTRPPGPLEMCEQIAVEHAANTIATLETQRAVRLAARLDDNGRQLSALAEPEAARPGEAAIADELEATTAPTLRARRLAELIDIYGVDPDHNQTDPADRYAAVLVAMIDREAPAAGSFDTLAHACEWLASGPLNTNPRDPACVVDLETGQHYTPELHVTVTLAREEQQLRAVIELRDDWLSDYTTAIGEHGSNDDEHELLVEIAESVQRQHPATAGEDDPAGYEPLAMLAFQPEALDSAAQFFLCLTANGPRVGGWVDRSGQGYTVDVLTKDGRRFTAEVRQVLTGDDGRYKLALAEWDEDTGRGNHNRLVTLDLYDELERIEVC